MCEESALSVLFLDSMGHAVSIVQGKTSPGGDICAVGGTGVGMECVSEYEGELDGGGGVFGGGGGGGVVGYAAGGGFVG